MANQFSRTQLMLGNKAMQNLKNSRVAVFGVGGVGGYVIEALARSGVGTLDIIDNDTVSVTNLNRQIIALHSTIGQSKVDVMKKRIADINPDCKVNVYNMFFEKSTADNFDFSKYNYVVDAIDSVKSKVLLAQICYNNNIKIISSMGTGNKLDPTKFEITDLYKTSYDPLAKVMRRELKKIGVKKLTVLYSKEEPVKLNPDEVSDLLDDEDLQKRSIPSSNAFVPSAAGLIIASKVVKDLVD